jgi:NADH-quinone oxidoreductase subunit C
MHVENYLKRFRPRREGDNIWLALGKTKLREVLKELKSLGLLRISSITGMDNGKDIEVIYHFIHKKKTINIKVSVEKKNSTIETITDIYPGANLFERELSEMLGIRIENHPNPKRLFLSEGSPENPLRRS